MILFPITAGVNSTWFYFLLTKVFKVEVKHALISSGLLAALLPLYSIILVKSYDSLGRSFVKLKFFFMRLFKRSLTREFNKTKKKLSKEIIKIVDEQGPEIYGIEENRIIQANEIEPPSTSRINTMNSEIEIQEK